MPQLAERLMTTVMPLTSLTSLSIRRCQPRYMTQLRKYGAQSASAHWITPAPRPNRDGDAVNVVSRLEGRTKAYGVGILVGEVTRKRVKDVVFREIDRIRVKGKENAVTFCQPLDVEPRLWEQALRLARVEDLRPRPPPPQWSGVTVFDEK